MTDIIRADIHGRRIETLDLIRGAAVMGILSVNIVDFAQPYALYLNPVAMGWPDLASWLVWIGNFLLVDGKMRTLFSMLFGASTLLVVERAEAAGLRPWSVHWHRMVVLLAIGFAHAILLWDGDILTLYALGGVVVYRARRRTARSLVIRGSVLIAFSMAVFGALTLFMIKADVAAHAPGATADAIRQWNSNGMQFWPTAAHLQQEIALHLGPWSGQVADRAGDVGQTLAVNFMLLPETAGLMMLGMAAYRNGLFTGAWDDARLKRLAAWAIPLGIAAHAVLIACEFHSRFYFAYFLGGFEAAMNPFRIVQALGYAALLVLASRGFGPFAERVAATGRAAFSNYLGTSLICTFIFDGWGLGHYGQWSRAEAWLVAPCIWTLMLLWSKPWLEHFHYGPLEWAWRSVSRWKLQPMRRNATA